MVGGGSYAVIGLTHFPQGRRQEARGLRPDRSPSRQSDAVRAIVNLEGIRPESHSSFDRHPCRGISHNCNRQEEFPHRIYGIIESIKDPRKCRERTRRRRRPRGRFHCGLHFNGTCFTTARLTTDPTVSSPHASTQPCPQSHPGNPTPHHTQRLVR